MTTRRLITTVLLAVTVFAVPGVVYYGFVDNAGSTHQTTSSLTEAGRQAFVPSPAFAQLGNTEVISNVAEQTIDSVVNISMSRTVKTQQSPLMDDPFFRRFFGPNQQQRPPEQTQRGLGSGVIVTEDGVILTNNHVVQNADELTVTLHDGREFDAEIVGTDPLSDVAVIRLTGDVDDLKPIAIGNSEELRLGDIVLAIGNPFGLSHTVTMGIVSALGRSDVQLATYEDFIQTDAAINPGNSGGALINLKGELIGVNTAIASQTGGYQGIGFAIPSNMAKTITDDLLESGKVTRGWLGVTIANLTPDIAEAMDLDITSGALINEVMPDSPATESGLQRGDVVTAVNGQEVDSSKRLMNIIALIEPNKTARLTVIREGRERSIDVTLGERPGQEEVASMGRSGGGRTGEVAGGMNVTVLTPASRQQYQVPDEVSGVLVANVQQGSPAAEAGITPGTVINGIGQSNEVLSVDELTSAFEDAGEKVLLYIWQQGRFRYVVVTKEG